MPLHFKGLNVIGHTAISCLSAYT